MSSNTSLRRFVGKLITEQARKQSWTGDVSDEQRIDHIIKTWSEESEYIDEAELRCCLQFYRVHKKVAHKQGVRPAS